VQGGQSTTPRTRALRLSFLWQPSADLKWNIAYEHYVDRGTPNMNLLQQQRPARTSGRR
jgi:iron complex outermembrane receptor protein